VKFLSIINIRYLSGLIALAFFVAPVSASQRYTVAELATAEQVQQAFKVFEQWTQFYQQKHYYKQHDLVHPRIQTYWDKHRWKKIMRKSQRKNGALESYEILAISPIKPANIPCTEMGHCYRKDMQVVIIIVNSHYKKIGDMNKEYILMANSADGWRWGGGTFLNTPGGETAGILDRNDVKRYQYKGIEKE